jgi:HD superfamily phosphohydrolase
LDEERARLAAENARLTEEVASLRHGGISSLAKKLASPWLAQKAVSRVPDHVRREDPIYGEFELDQKLFPVFSHPLFQRLNYVRQLSFAYLVFPSASHTRLSHIQGVVRNAQVAMRTVFNKNLIYRPGRNKPDLIELTPEQRDRCCTKAQLCALLHDIGHGPFGHALDKLMTYLGTGTGTALPDKVLSARYIEENLSEEIRAVGFTVDEVLDILVKERRADLGSWDVFVADLIDSQFDVDRMDYLPRDAHMTGLAMGSSNVQALVEHICPFQDERDKVSLTFDESALPHLEHLLYAHDIMYINCYEHPRKLCAERLLFRLAEYLLGQGLTSETLMLLTDEQLLATLGWLLPADGPERECLRSIQENCNFYAAVTPPYPLSTLEWDPDKKSMLPQFNRGLNREIEGWYRRRPQGKAHLKFIFGDQPKSWEERICAEAGIGERDRWKVVVTVPAYEAKQAEESGTTVLERTASGYNTRDLFGASPVMRAVVTNLIPAREVIHVLVSEDLPQALAEKVGIAADRVFRT